MSHVFTPTAPDVPAPPDAGRPVSRALFALAGMFFLVVAAAWAWFHVGVKPPADGIRFAVRTDIPGWRFEAEPVPPKAQETLATTNLLNGVFYGAGGRQVVAFAAEWHAGDARQLSVVQHTPDVCWVGVGWEPVVGDHPDTIQLTVGGRPLPFECRVFATPGGGQAQLVIWCTLISGRPAAEGRRFDTELELADADSRDRHIAAARRLVASQFIEGVSLRRAATGDKQFVRLSVPYDGDFPAARARLEGFVGRWLEVVPLSPGRNS